MRWTTRKSRLRVVGTTIKLEIYHGMLKSNGKSFLLKTELTALKDITIKDTPSSPDMTRASG